MHVAPYVSTDIYRGTERQAPASWGASYPIKIKTTKVIKRSETKQKSSSRGGLYHRRQFSCEEQYVFIFPLY